MKNTLLLIGVMSVLLIGYQNCGQLSSEHTGGDGSSILNSDDPSDNSPEILRQDEIISALEPAALNVWGNRCQECHASRPISGFGDWGESILDGTGTDYRIAASKLSFDHGGGKSMPTNGTLNASEQAGLLEWVQAIQTKRDLLTGSVENCRANSLAGYGLDIKPLLAKEHVNYQGQDRSCTSCHASAQNFKPFLSGNDASDLSNLRALSFPRKPEASIVYDALQPQDGSSPSSYHETSPEAIAVVANWINGCMPD